MAVRPSAETLFYGDGPSQFGDLSIPDRPGSRPVVVLVHGGFWRAAYGLELMEPLAADLNDRGFPTWNIEYRRVGEPGGGYPNTLIDVAAAIDHVATIDDDRLDLERIAVVGHSAGGHLALWCASRGTIPAGSPGADPAVTPNLAIGQAPVADLAGAFEADLSSGAVRDFLGGDPSEVPDRYAVAQPDLADAAERSLIVHGDADLIVPLSQTTLAEEAGVAVTVIAGADHLDVIDPAHVAWAAVIEALASL